MCSRQVLLIYILIWSPFQLKVNAPLCGSGRHRSSKPVAPYILNSALNGHNYLVSGSGYFIPRETAPDSHWIEGWVNPRSEEHLVLAWIRAPSSSVARTVLSHYAHYDVVNYSNYLSTYCFNSFIFACRSCFIIRNRWSVLLTSDPLGNLAVVPSTVTIALWTLSKCDCSKQQTRLLISSSLF